MGGPLIIDARHRLRWHQRLFSDAATATMWAWWLWLWTPLLRSSTWMPHLGSRSYSALANLLASGSAVGLERHFVLLAGTSGTLLVWNSIPARKAHGPELRSPADYARYFDLPEPELQAGRAASVCVVHHDESGRIVRVEARAPGRAVPLPMTCDSPIPVACEPVAQVAA